MACESANMSVDLVCQRACKDCLGKLKRWNLLRGVLCLIRKVDIVIINVRTNGMWLDYWKNTRKVLSQFCEEVLQRSVILE